MEQLINAQQELYGRISRTYDNLKKAGAAKVTAGLIRSSLSLLEAKWSKFEAQHARLRDDYGCELAKHEYFTGDFICVAETVYLQQRAALLELEESLPSPSGHEETKLVRSESSLHRKALPRIQLPEFSGKFEDWPQFRDLFWSIVVQEPSLSKAEKMHYLKASVKGNAEQLIRSLPSTEDNFERAWTVLSDHFENKRLLVRSYLTALTSLPRMKPDSVSDLRKIFHGALAAVGALEDVGRPIIDCSDLFIHLVVELLDVKTRREWERSLGRSTEPPSFSELRDFLEETLVTQEVLRVSKEQHSGRASDGPFRSTRANLAGKRGSESGRSCPICKQNHFIMVCEQYKAQSAQGRRDMVAAHKLCWNCLGRHQVSGCPSSKSCGKCAARHNTSLHDAFVPAPPVAVGPGPTTAVHVAQPPLVECSPVLLATARVLVADRYGAQHAVRALIDSGSETCLISESLVQRLRLPRSPAAVAIYGIGGQQSGVSRGSVIVALTSRASGATLDVSALVFPRLTVYSAATGSDPRFWVHLEGLELADPDFLGREHVELLLGADAYADIALPGLRRGNPNEPIAQQTRFGWIILGPVGVNSTTSAISTLQCSPVDELTILMRRFWEQEEPPCSPAPLSPSEKECEEHFAGTHTRAPDGRYCVRLPFRGEPPDLAATSRAAMKMLELMSRRFERDPSFRSRYQEFMKEYVALGHMSMASQPLSTPSSRGCYLPHHGVLKGAGSTAKIRVVFNGSVRTADGSSLNQSLHTGQNLLPSLIDVIIRWRWHRYVISTDIEKMYRQILVHPEDREWQRILWKENNEVKEYCLNTVTYGVTSAPYLAVRVLCQLAEDEKTRFPQGAETLRRDTYVDDIVSGAPTLEETRQLRDQLVRLCMAGGFPLRKWAANHAALLSGIPSEHRAGCIDETFLVSEVQAVLGLRWNSERDYLALSVRLPPPALHTKRSLLSRAAQLFDPLGWIAPVIVRAILLIQSTWLQQLDWDAPLEEEEASLWSELETELPLLEGIQLSRWVRGDQPGCRIEVHGFSDASERAYAAVVYLRAKEADGVHVSLVLAKSRVAPLKRISLPRLELCAAGLLAKLAAHVCATLQLSLDLLHLWTDSTVTLGWIRGHPARWTTYVANRVAEIHRTVADGRWHHVPGRENPADCASRELSPKELLSHELWWQGPNFLLQEPYQWPSDPGQLETRDLPEQRTGRCLTASKLQEPEELKRFSSLRRLLRVTAWILRWHTCLALDRAEKARGSDVAALAPEELERAMDKWFRVVQSLAFRPELESVIAGRPGRSSLRGLAPAIDDRRLLRVGGRIKHSLLTTDQRHPVILPPESHLTYLIIDESHRRTLHGGTQLTLATIRQRFWLPRGRQLVRRQIHRCPPCVLWRAASSQPLMGSLPRVRVTPSRPFLHTGVDFAGPILLRTTKGRGHKAYKAFLSVFVCFSTRAVHLEVVSDYTTEAFLAALRRFVSRRGLCDTIYSDCGTNFVGADNQLRVLFKPASREIHKIIGRLADQGMRWRFSPPAAPHFGDLWEASVKAVKHHLRRVIGEMRLTFEEMATFLAEVEACLNSRPLQALSDDPDDLNALTPGHFLIGGPLNAVPEPSLVDCPAGRLSRWRLLQGMRDHWWRRWSEEYVQSLIPRPKWWKSTGGLKEGQLCLLRSEATPPSHWPLARITRLHCGEDDQVRVVEVRTARGILTRPVVKIVPLPTCENDTPPSAPSES